MSKGGVISVNNEMGAIQVITPGFQGMDNREQFLFMSWIITFSGVHFPRCKGNRVRDAIAIDLEKNSADGES
jgi:hypothetical protein